MKPTAFEPTFRRVLMLGSALIVAAVLLPARPASARARDAHRWDVEESRTVTEVLSFPAATGDNVLVVDNVNGSIKVTGHGGGEVRLVAREVVRARTQADMERARSEAGLAIDRDGSTVYLIVDGPFRRRDGSIHWHRDLGYELHYDFEIEVPYRTSLVLKNVNGGDVEARGVEGELEVSNVNGAVAAQEIAGHGRFHTVNGGIDVSFAASPDGDCDFRTVNGNVDVGFPGDLAADLRFKTFNGDVYTDFDYTPRAVERPAPARRGGRTTWKSLGHGARIAGGGPEMSFDTLNGNIYIRNTDR